jgi:hypothetical protein
MALRKLEADLSIISRLGTNPGIDDGLSESELKAKFDEAANIIKDYLNNYLILQIEKTVDVESLLSDILDVTLTKSDKAANAKSTGDEIRGLRTFFEKVVHSGDYALDSDGNFEAEIIGDSVIRINGGEGVIQGNLFSLNVGAYEQIDLEPGTYGLFRNDLVVIRCVKDENNILNYSLAALTGKNTSGDPVDPSYYIGDINGSAKIHDFPLYRIRFDGYDITDVQSLFRVEKNLSEYVESRRISHAVILSANLWESEEGKTSYRQKVAVNGVTSDESLSDVVACPDPDEANYNAYLDSGVRAIAQHENAVEFICDEKPDADLTVNLSVFT